jgi:hypothetical protein
MFIPSSPQVLKAPIVIPAGGRELVKLPENVSTMGSQKFKLRNGFELCPPDTLSTGEWINDSNTGIREIITVSGCDRKIVNDGRRRDEAIFDRHGLSVRAKARQQFRPFQTRVPIPGQTTETRNPSAEPAFQCCSLPSFRQKENSESQLTENHWIDGDVWLICAKPFDDTRIRAGFRRLTENVCVNQVFHNTSVDSESIGTK